MGGLLSNLYDGRYQGRGRGSQSRHMVCLSLKDWVERYQVVKARESVLDRGHIMCKDTEANGTTAYLGSTK